MVMMVKTEACIEVWLRCLRWISGGAGLHERESERESDTEHRLNRAKRKLIGSKMVGEKTFGLE